MNIFIRELRANRKALIIWSVCMALVVFSGMGKYSAYSAGGASSDVFDKIPLVMKQILGLGTFDVTKMSGFYAFLFPYVEVTVAIHAILLGTGILMKEERDKTTEFLITRPVSRFTIITSKLLAALFNVVIINIVTLFSSLVIVSSFNSKEVITGEIITFMISMFFVQLIFLSLGTLMAAFMRKPKTSGSIGVGILLGAFIISKVTDITDRLNFLNILSPFKYFNMVDIVYKNSLNIAIIFISLALTVVFIVATYYFYEKRDLNV